MRTVASVEIECPIDEVFEYTNNNVAEWSTIVVSDVPIDEKPGVVGTKFRMVTEERGQRMTFEGEVTRYKSPHESASYLTGPSFDIDVEYLFEDLRDRTRLTQTSIIHAKGFTKVMFFLFGWMMKSSGEKSVNQELRNLKDKLESRD